MKKWTAKIGRRAKTAMVDTLVAAVGMAGLLIMCHVLSVTNHPTGQSPPPDHPRSQDHSVQAPRDARPHLSEVGAATRGWAPSRGAVMVWLVGSFGASVTLLLTCPDSEMAKTYPAIVGNAVSAVVGVAVQQMLGASHPQWAAAGAVTGAVGVMSWLKALHPPGGATALIAVIGGPAIHRLGWWYPLCPITLGTLWLLALARLRAVCRKPLD